MKTLFICFLILNCIFPSIHAEENNETKDQRSLIIYLNNSYIGSLNFLSQVSNIISNNSNDLIKRDLIICERIGETYGTINNLIIESFKIAELLKNNIMYSDIDKLRDPLLFGSYNLTEFCKYNSPKYRDIDQLKNAITDSYNLINVLSNVTLNNSKSN